jgi:hypothetical protein
MPANFFGNERSRSGETGLRESLEGPHLPDIIIVRRIEPSLYDLIATNILMLDYVTLMLSRFSAVTSGLPSIWNVEGMMDQPLSGYGHVQLLRSTLEGSM